MERANLKSKKFTFLNDLNLSDEVIQKLTSYLHLVLKGSENELLTPIAKDNDPQLILKSWDDIFQSKSTYINEPLKNLEMLNRSKFGARSIAKNWIERKSDVISYFDAKESVINQNSVIRNSPNSRSLRPLSIHKAIKHLKNTTSSGLPFMVKKATVKSEVVKDFDSILERKDPAILFTRTQEGNKTRTVWGFPIADTLNEMMYYRPLLEYQSKLTWRSALRGPKFVDNEMEKIINICRNNKTFKIVSADFSKYDASISKILIDAAFYYIKNLFQIKGWKDLDYIKDRFITIGILTPEGVLNGVHGVPSGSTFTNEVDSIVQYLIAKSVLNDDNCLAIQIQGDDGVYVIKPEVYDHLINAFKKAGLDFNVDKSYYEKDWAVYLQNLYHSDYPLDKSRGKFGGVYPTYRALNRILHQERFTDLESIGLKGEDYFSIRAISILENCKYHPLFEDLVRFIYELDKFKLGYTQKGLQIYSEHIKENEGAEDIVSNQYGDQLTGFNNFETVKLLRKIANL